MKLLSDPFQVDPTVKYQMELTDIQNDSNSKRAFSEQDLLSFDASCVSSELPQFVEAPTAASNCFQKWKTQKRNQGLWLQMNIWQHHCIFRLLLLEQM